MKFLASTNNSICSSEGNNSNANYNSKISCNIYGLFRRLLCSNSHPTQSLSTTTYQQVDHDNKELTDGLVMCHEKQDQPGVVARLMGLESMPATSSACRSISRSRSMNFIDSLRQLENIKGRYHRHSFREPPTMSSYLELEDENFFILSFESETKQGKTEAETKQRRKKKLHNNKSTSQDNVYPTNYNKENYLHVNNKVSTDQKLHEDDDKVIIMHKAASQILKDSSNMQDSQGARTRRKTKTKTKKKKDERFPIEKPVIESDSEKSSPNSVLDFVDTQNTVKFSRLTSSRSRRTLYEELENYRKLKLVIGYNGVEAKRSDQQQRNCADQSRKKEYDKDENCVHFWRRCICKLADRETVERRNWEQNEIEYCKEIGAGLGLEILDQLLEELVDQLAGEQPLY